MPNFQTQHPFQARSNYSGNQIAKTRLRLLATVATTGLLVAMASPQASAQSFGGNGGGQTSTTGLSSSNNPNGTNGGSSDYGVGGSQGQNGGDADPTTEAGGGGGGADAFGGAAGAADGQSGGAGGNGGASNTFLTPAQFSNNAGLTATGGADADPATHVLTDPTTTIDFGGGGGGAGGTGALVSGTGAFATTANITAGNGGNGGEALYDSSNGYGEGYGYGYGNYTGGNGGDGGVGVSMDRGEQFTVNGTAVVLGGLGGNGGLADYAYGYGSEAYGFGGSGGNGGAGILMLAPAEIDGGAQKVNIGSTATVQGGNGGEGNEGNSYIGYGYGGNGGNGGDGIRILAGGTVDNAGTVLGGNGGSPDFGNMSDGLAGIGGAGINALNGATITNTGSITGGIGGDDFEGDAGGLGGAGITGNVINLTNGPGGTITGGQGGNSVFSGLPGAGGAAIAATGSIITNQGTITGGNAGNTGTLSNDIALSVRSLDELPLVQQLDVPGGVGIIGSDLEVFNSGTIQGGFSANGVQNQLAIEFIGGTNSLTIESGSTIVGIAQAFVGADGSKNDTFALGGDVTPATPFDVGSITEIGAPSQVTTVQDPPVQYEGFGIFEKTGLSTWTLTGTTDYLTPWQILQGTLAIGADNNLGNPAGGVTLNGGNLETTATITSARTFTVGPNGGGLNTDANTTLTLTSPIVNGAGGGGVLSKLGAGTLVIEVDSSYTGGTKIANGTIDIATPGGLGTGTVFMATPTAPDQTTLGFLNSFTFANNVVLTGTGDPTVDTGANTDTMSGIISGGGALTKAGTGTLILTGLNTYTGGTTIAQGTLVGSSTSFGSGPIVDNAALVFNQPTTASFANPISGPGTVTKTGAGRLDLTGTNTYTGATTITAGTLLVDGATANSVVTAQTGTTLGGFGTVGGIVALAGSTVAPGLVVPYSTLHVNGNVTFQPGSTYQVQINAGGQTNLILATGTATIGGGTVNVTAVDGAYNAAQRFTIVTAQAGRTGTFSNLTTTTNLAFLQPYLGYDPNDVFIAFRAQNPTNVPVCQTVNQRAAQSGLVGLGAGNQLFDKFLGQTVAGARAACDAVSGEIHASAATAAFEDNRFPRESILDRLDDAAHDGPNAYGALGGFGTQPVLPAGAQGYAPVYKGYDKPVPPPRPAPYTAWGTGWGDFGQFGGNGNAATLDRSLGGFIAGVDTRVDGPYFNNWHVGVAGGYSNDSLSVPGRGSNGTFEMYYGGLYAGAQYGAVDLKFGALGGGTHLDTDRTIAFPGFNETASSSLGGTMAQGFGEIGYKFAFARGFIEPFAQGAAIYYGQDGFRESGGLAALRGFGRDYNFETSLLGFKAESSPFANLPIIARVVLGWRHAFGDLTPASVLAFEAGGPDFTVFGAPIDQDAVLAEAGFDYRATSNLTIGVNYSGQAGERAYDNAVKGRLEYRF